MALEEQFAALEEAAGCWGDDDHPELRTDEDIDRWLSCGDLGTNTWLL